MIVLDLDHERGDFSEYSNGKVDANNRLSVTTNAASIGKYGVECVLVDDATKYYADHDFFWLEVSDWRFRIYVKLDNVSMGSGNRFRLVHTTGGNGSNLYVFIGYSSSIGFYTRVFFYYDGGSYITSADVPLSATGWNRIECVTQRATNASASDGRVAIEINGTQQWEQTGVDIYDRAPPDNIQVGVPRADLEAATSGTIYFDGIAIANSSATAIGDEQGGVIWYQVDANNRNCRDLRNENSAFSNTLFGWGSWWSSGGVSFAADVIPKGATIHSAYIVVRSQSADGAFSANIYGEDVDNGSLFSAALPSFTRTTQSASWSDNFDSANKLFNTPDLSSIVSAITSRSGWVPGNNLTFEIDGLDNLANPFSYNDSATWAPRMRVVFSEASTQDYPVSMSAASVVSTASNVASGVGASTNVSKQVSVMDAPVANASVSKDIASVASSVASALSGVIANVNPGVVTLSVSVSQSGVITVDILATRASASALSEQIGANVTAPHSATMSIATSESSAAYVSTPMSIVLVAQDDVVSTLYMGTTYSKVLSDVASVVSGVTANTTEQSALAANSSVSSTVAALISTAIAASLSNTTGANFLFDVSTSAIMGVDIGFVGDIVASAAIDGQRAVYSDTISAVETAISILSSSVAPLSVVSDTEDSVSLINVYSAQSSMAYGVSVSVDIVRQAMHSASVASSVGVNLTEGVAASIAAAVISLVDSGINVQKVTLVSTSEAGAAFALLVDVIMTDGAAYTVVVTNEGIGGVVMSDTNAATASETNDAAAASLQEAAPEASVTNTGGGTQA